MHHIQIGFKSHVTYMYTRVERTFTAVPISVHLHANDDGKATGQKEKLYSVVWRACMSTESVWLLQFLWILLCRLNCGMPEQKRAAFFFVTQKRKRNVKCNNNNWRNNSNNNIIILHLELFNSVCMCFEVRSFFFLVVFYFLRLQATTKLKLNLMKSAKRWQ